jgi:hypothetical protein
VQCICSYPHTTKYKTTGPLKGCPMTDGDDVLTSKKLVDYPAVPLALATPLRKRRGGTAPPSESLIASANLADKMNQN